MNTFDIHDLDLARAGDRQAFGRLVKQLMPRLYGVVYTLTPQPDEVYDILQDSFVKAYRALPRLRDNAAFLPWLYRIAINTARSRLSRRREFAAEPDSAVFLEVVQADVAWEQVDQHERQALVQRALAQLSLEHREVVVLVELESLNCNEVAELLGCPPGTVRSRLHYARKQLKSLLNPYRSWFYPEEKKAHD
ncbi:MAG: RNA polymerase sigma factor [Candidatus Sericytochromatia bacterium]